MGLLALRLHMNGYFRARMDHSYGVFKANTSQDRLANWHNASHNPLEGRLVQPKPQEDFAKHRFATVEAGYALACEKPSC